MDRLIFAGLYRLAPTVFNALAIVKPETVIKWHRTALALEVEAPWFCEMSIANPLWGAPRIRAEDLCIIFEVIISDRVIGKNRNGS